jgi:hypothetical protein
VEADEDDDPKYGDGVDEICVGFGIDDGCE